MRSLVLGAVLAGAVSLSACAGGVREVVGAYPINDQVSITLTRPWSDMTARHRDIERQVRFLTIDGPLLNRLYVFADIEPGRSLWRESNRRERERLPAFRADMTSRELIELMSEHLVRLGLQRVEEADIAPTTFAGAPGVRVRYTTQTRNGLEMGALAVMANVNGKLRGALFLAPSEYYFDRDLADVERAIASAGQPAAPPTPTR